MARIASATGRYGGRPASERHAERRMRLREAGLDLFGAGPGYRNSRLVDVCKRAGLSTRQFYEEYHTLEDLLADLHLSVNELAEQRLVAEIGLVADLPIRDRVARIVHTYIDAVTVDPRFTRILFVEIVGVSERLDQQRLERRSRWIELLVQLYEDALRRGDITPFDPRLTAATFVGSVNGLMHDWTVGWVDATSDQVADELQRMLIGRLELSHAEDLA
ncbi:TetR/AcrR family transcriptional regulator [Nocardia arizonensis]|uniref:TetR/AcrR family transcriptional regulator n=1 Tax=Nocardia arizonensis TaxID=1141647 RepID=UPI0006D01FFF|nr:TetR/AcrR family transcriptional regulator [Nocardia arizonensis]